MQSEFDLGEYEGRALPQDLALLLENKTQAEDDLQECMKEFVECMIINRKHPFCGIDREGHKRLFETLCDLTYDNCKHGEEIWHYFIDDKCT